MNQPQVLPVITVMPSSWPCTNKFEVNAVVSHSGSDWIRPRKARSSRPIVDYRGNTLETKAHDLARALAAIPGVTDIQIMHKGVRVMLNTVLYSWSSVQHQVAGVLASHLNWPDYQLTALPRSTKSFFGSSAVRVSTS